jgi:excisionase family DNA binding protein
MVRLSDLVDWRGIADPCPMTDVEPLMTPAEVAALFGVDPKTVTTWANRGRLSCIRTLGGHRRFRVREVMALHEELTTVVNSPGY